MKTRYTIPVLLTLFVITYALQLVAQSKADIQRGVPSFVKFAGRLAGANGEPLPGTQGVTFLLYKEEKGGGPLWMETQNVHTDRNGRYSVMLGSSTAYGLPAEIFEGDGARWLGVQASGESEQPRILLFSLPYGGIRASLAAGQTVSPAPAAEEGPSPQGGQKKPPTVHGNGVVKFIPVWTDTSIIGESVMTQTGTMIGVAGELITTGSVGVGTAAPATNLDVFAGSPGVHAPMARFGSNGGNDANSILTYTGSGTAELWQSGCVNCFMPGVQIGDGGLRVNPGKSLFLGDSTNSRLRLDSAGNASQPRTANGMVKAMFKFSPFNGGRIVTCFNSTLSGTAATTPPCGFSFKIEGAGGYLFSFGFQVDDRILSLTGGTNIASGFLTACTDLDGCDFLNNQQVEVGSEDGGNFVDQKVYLIVY